MRLVKKKDFIFFYLNCLPHHCPSAVFFFFLLNKTLLLFHSHSHLHLQTSNPPLFSLLLSQPHFNPPFLFQELLQQQEHISAMTSRVLASTLVRQPSLRLVSPMRCSPFVSAKPSLLSHARPSNLTRRHHSTSPFHSSSPPPKVIAAAIPVSKTPLWQKVAIGGTIALATSATLLNQIAKSPQMEAAIRDAAAAGTSPTGNNIVDDLKDEHNRIGVEKKSTSELMLSMMVYKLCTFSLLVDLAPQLISLAEMVHLTPPVYWFVRKTFFAQFCG